MSGASPAGIREENLKTEWPCTNHKQRKHPGGRRGYKGGLEGFCFSLPARQTLPLPYSPTVVLGRIQYCPDANHNCCSSLVLDGGGLRYIFPTKNFSFGRQGRWCSNTRGFRRLPDSHRPSTCLCLFMYQALKGEAFQRAILVPSNSFLFATFCAERQEHWWRNCHSLHSGQTSHGSENFAVDERSTKNERLSPPARREG